MKNWVPAHSSVLFLLLFFPALAAAQDYAFEVSRMHLEVTVNEDASATAQYSIEFRNWKGAHAIDIVDIGTFHDDYDFSNMKATIGTIELPDTAIRKSEYVTPGVEVHLGQGAIEADSTGIFIFTYTMPDIAYRDEKNPDYASVRVTPTWFDGQFIKNKTDLKIAIHMPKGVAPEDVIYQDVPFEQKVLYRERAVATWHFPNTRLIGPTHVGVSFPRHTMKRVVTITRFEKTMRKWEAPANKIVRNIFILVVLVLYSLMWRRFTGRTGCVPWFLIGAGAFAAMYFFPRVQIYSIPVWIAAFAGIEWSIRKKRKKYLPAMATVEGGGIKRGLTAPQAAVLLELQLSRVLALVLFSLLKKGVLRQTGADPLAVEVLPEYAGGRKVRRKAAEKHGVVIHKYEHPFLDALATSPGAVVEGVDFARGLQGLIDATVKRMQGFDLSETRDYYRAIVDRSWREAKSLKVAAERKKVIDRNLEWLLIDDTRDDWFDDDDRWGDDDRYYRPAWVGPERAETFHRWADKLEGGLAEAIPPGAVGLDDGKGGVLDLSGFDKVTKDVFEALGSSSSSGGGSSGGGGFSSSCACACAGCACACACAGGGR